MGDSLKSEKKEKVNNKCVLKNKKNKTAEKYRKINNIGQKIIWHIKHILTAKCYSCVAFFYPVVVDYYNEGSVSVISLNNS